MHWFYTRAALFILMALYGWKIHGREKRIRPSGSSELLAHPSFSSLFSSTQELNVCYYWVGWAFLKRFWMLVELFCLLTAACIKGEVVDLPPAPSELLQGQNRDQTRETLWLWGKGVCTSPFPLLFAPNNCHKRDILNKGDRAPADPTIPGDCFPFTLWPKQGNRRAP